METNNDKPKPDFKQRAREIVALNELELDKECVRLPSDYLKYAHRTAEARQSVEQAKAEMALVEAEVSRAVRATPGKYGIEKETEKSISAAIESNKRYLEAAALVRKAQYEYELAQAVVWALEHKKRALTLLVDLHGMGYFSNPKLSPEGRRAVENMTKEAVRPRRRAALGD